MADPGSGASVSLPQCSSARFVRRLNRFAGLVQFPGSAECHRAHVPSSGRMGELLYPGASVRVSPSHSATRSTEYTVVLAEAGGGWVCIDSHLPNRLASIALRVGVIEGVSHLDQVRSEVPFRGQRLDFLAETAQGHMLIEVKSVTLVEGGLGLFPDAPTERGTRQLKVMRTGLDAGLSAMVLFIIQRGDALRFSPHDRMDGAFGSALRALKASGGVVRAYVCAVDDAAVRLGAEVPVLL